MGAFYTELLGQDGWREGGEVANAVREAVLTPTAGALECR
jgi:hypothetical protein